MGSALPQPLAVSGIMCISGLPTPLQTYPMRGLSNMPPLPASLTPLSSCFSPRVLRQASAPTRTAGGSGLPQSRCLPPLATPKGQWGPGHTTLCGGEATGRKEHLAEGGRAPTRQYQFHRHQRGAGQEICLPCAGCDLSGSRGCPGVRGGVDGS